MCISGLTHNLNVDRSGEQDFEAVENCVAEFAKIDPLSQTFRYPTSRRGQPFEIDHEGIDLLHLQETMKAIENYFEGWDGFLDNMKYSQPEW